MKSLWSKVYQRVSLLSISIVLALSSIGTVLPILFSQTAAAAPSIVYTPATFDNLSLTPDRTAPSGGYNTNGGILTENIDSTIAKPSSTFYQTEGLQGTLAANTSSIKADLYIDPAWSTTNVEVGLWGITSSGNPANGNAWPILQYTNYQGAGRFRMYDTMVTGDWTDLLGTVTPGQTYTLEIAFNAATSEYDFYVNNVKLGSENAIDNGSGGSGATFGTFTGVIFDNYNFATGNSADNYSVQWQNFDTGTAIPATPTNLMFQDGPTTIPSGSIFNTTSVTNNTDLVWSAGSSEATDAYQTQITYPNGNVVTQWTSTKNLWIGKTPYLDNMFGEEGDGVYSYQVEARSAVTGLWSNWSSPVNLIYDTTAPVVTVTPVAGSLLHGTETFHITVTDANLNPNILKHIYVYLYNNNPPQASQGASVDLSSGSANFTVDTTKLADGLATFDVQKLFDAAGNASGTNDSYFKNYVIDNTAPTVPTLLTPSNNGFEKTNDFYFTWTASTDASPITYEYQSSNSPTVDGNGSLENAWDSITDGNSEQNNLTTPEIHSTGAPDGVYYWQVRAIDAAGNKSAWTAPWKMTIDTVAPTVTANGLLTNDPTPHLTGTVNDPTATVEVTVAGHTYTAINNGSTWTVHITHFVSDGSHTIAVTATDPAGNVGNATSTLTVDTTKPVVTISNPTNGELINGTVTITGTATDNDLHSYSWTIKNSHGHTVYSREHTASTVTSHSWNTTSVPDGDYTIYLTATDGAGNTTSRSVHITVDNTAPAVPTLTFPVSGVFRTTSNSNESDWSTVTDPHGPVTYIYQSAFDSNFTNIAFTSTPLTATSIANPGEPEGTYYWHVKACDALDNCSAWSTYSVINIDNTAPTVPGTPITATPVSSDTSDWTWTASADVNGPANSGVKGYYYTLTQGSTPVVPLTFTVDPNATTTVTSDGTYTLSVYAVDNVGNESATSTADVTVDTTAPVVTIPSYSTNGNVITPTVTATDLNSPLTYAWTADNTASGANVTISDASALEPTFTVNQDGTYSFTLTATDPAGNPGTQTFAFTYITPTTPVAPATNVPVVNTPTTGNGFTNVAATNQGVLGVSTTTPNVKNDKAVLGTSTNKPSTTPWTLAWYWWALIIAAVIALLWWIIAAIRRRQQQNG